MTPIEIPLAKDASNSSIQTPVITARISNGQGRLTAPQCGKTLLLLNSWHRKGHHQPTEVLEC